MFCPATFFGKRFFLLTLLAFPYAICYDNRGMKRIFTQRNITRTGGIPLTTWYDSCYRKLFFDYHTQRNATEVGAQFDGAAWAETLQAAGVQAVSCIAKCGYGWRYYRKGRVGFVHPHLPKGLDILEDTVRECHRRGIRVIAYYHTFGSEPLAESHPEWLIRDADGTPSGIAMCLLGDALEKEMLPQLAEIAGNYDVDGVFLDGTYHAGKVCYCESCKARFRRETGMELPRSKDDESYPIYMNWVEKAYIRVRERCLEAVRAANPGVLLSFNWAYTTRQPEPVPADVGFMTQDISQSNMAQSISLQARNWALTGRSFDVMNHLALKWWQDWSIKPVNSVIQECALLLANGGRTWMGYQMYPWFGVEDALMDTVRAAFNYVRRMEPLVSGARVVPYVGVLHSQTQAHTRPVDDFQLYVDEKTIFGVHRALTLGGIPYHSACTGDFLKHLGRFKAIVLTGDQYLEPATLAAVRAYVEAGGKALVTGRTGMVDEQGRFLKNPAMEALIGCEIADGYPYSHGYIVDNGVCEALTRSAGSAPVLCGRPLTYATPATATALADARYMYIRSDGCQLFTEGTSEGQTFSPPGKPTGTAAITVNQVGRGAVVYIASDVFAAYAGNSQWRLKNMIRSLINDVLLKEDAIRIDAPDYVEMALMEDGSALHVHLVNLVRESPMVDFSSAIENIIGEDVLPIHDIRLSIPCRKPARVRLAMSGADAEWSHSSGVLTVRVPKLTIHECVAIDFDSQEENHHGI